jgi:predicted dehydrogenase
MKMVKVALAGAGGYGEYFYLQHLLEDTFHLPVSLVGIVEPYPERTPSCAVCRERGIPIYPDVESFYREHTADLMIVSSPIPYHASQSVYAVSHGSHVLCEKPTAALPSDAQKMLLAEKNTGKSIFIGFQLSFTEPILSLKRDILSGRFGRALSGKCMVLWERDFAYYTRGSGWAGKLKTAKGEAIRDSIASNAAAHYLHNLLFLLGSDLSSASQAEVMDAELCRANDIETFDTCVLRLREQNGAKLLFIASHATKGWLDPVFQLRFEHGTVYCTENGEPRLWAVMDDGSVIEYGNPKTEKQTAQKLIRTVQWIAGEGEKPVCTVSTTLPFQHVIDSLFTNEEFVPFHESEIIRDEERGRVYVSGLYERLTQLYESEDL